MTKPNLFIVGAPKCGTTSLANWLACHPQVYMSAKKEPHWFNFDHNHGNVKSLEEYQRLFKDTDLNTHQVIGEASVWYLYSNEAIPRILEYSPDSQFIVMVRNPIEMAFSLHEQMLFAGYENEHDFRKAWDSQERREAGRDIPLQCSEPSYIQYGCACSLGSQLESLLSWVCPDRVHIIVLDDMRTHPRHEYLKLLNFLSLNDDGRSQFQAKNTAKVRRWQTVLRATKTLGRLKQIIGIRRGLGILTAIERANTKHRPRPIADPEVRYELEQYFAPEIQKMERILERDFSGWLSEETKKAPGSKG